LAVTDWRLRRWRLCFLALSNAPRIFNVKSTPNSLFFSGFTDEFGNGRPQSSSVSPRGGYAGGSSAASTPQSSSGAPGEGGASSSGSADGANGPPGPAAPYGSAYGSPQLTNLSTSTGSLFGSTSSDLVSRMGGLVSPFGNVNPFALPTCSAQGYGGGVGVGVGGVGHNGAITPTLLGSK